MRLLQLPYCYYYIYVYEFDMSIYRLIIIIMQHANLPQLNFVVVGCDMREKFLQYAASFDIKFSLSHFV